VPLQKKGKMQTCEIPVIFLTSRPAPTRAFRMGDTFVHFSATGLYLSTLAIAAPVSERPPTT
jgi:hypothetical protein